jgi:site-specific recombinase XerD
VQPVVYEYLQRFIDYLEAEKHASRYTVRNYRSDLVGNLQHGEAKGFFQFLDQCGVDSLDAVDKPIMRAYLGHLVNQHVAVEEAFKLIGMPDVSKPFGQRDRAIIELIYAAGMRISELTQLNLIQIDLDFRQIRVLGKGNKERLVIIGQPAASALKAYLKDGRQALLGKIKSEAVFVNRNGKRLTERWVQMLMVKYATAAGIDKNVHPHLLRHTFATHMLDGGADLRVVQDLLGHANLATTQIYTHVTQNQARKVYMASHPMASTRDGKNEPYNETLAKTEDYAI